MIKSNQLGMFLIGFGAGMIGTTLLVQKYYENKMIEELEATRKSYLDAFNYSKSKEYKETGKQVTEGSSDAVDETGQKISNVEKIDYTAFYHKGKAEPQEKELAIDEFVQFPYIITEEDYYHTKSKYKKQTVYYYEDDDVLADENGIEYESYDELVGDGPLMLGLGSNDVEKVYVRNTDLSTDFEIIRRCSFQEGGEV